jgi:hypothetical protein
MNKNDGGSAFPTTEANYHNENMRGDGLSIRDYFAAKIFAAMIAGGHWPIDATSEDQARMAYKHSDAMIAERAK